MLGRMLLHSMVMIVGPGLMFGSIMMLTVSPDPDPLISIPLLIVSPIAAGFSFWRLRVLNRSFQDDAKTQALADPDSVYAQWQDDGGRELMLARTGLFIDDAFHAFAQPYSRLVGIALDGTQLRVNMVVKAGRMRVERNEVLEVPHEHLEALARAVLELHPDDA